MIYGRGKSITLEEIALLKSKDLQNQLVNQFESQGESLTVKYKHTQHKKNTSKRPKKNKGKSVKV